MEMEVRSASVQVLKSSTWVAQLDTSTLLGIWSTTTCGRGARAAQRAQQGSTHSDGQGSARMQCAAGRDGAVARGRRSNTCCCSSQAGTQSALLCEEHVAAGGWAAGWTDKSVWGTAAAPSTARGAEAAPTAAPAPIPHISCTQPGASLSTCNAPPAHYLPAKNNPALQVLAAASGPRHKSPAAARRWPWPPPRCAAGHRRRRQHGCGPRPAGRGGESVDIGTREAGAAIGSGLDEDLLAFCYVLPLAPELNP